MQSSLRDLGAPGWMIDFLARLPVFGLSPWIFVLVGIVLIYFGFKVGSQWR